MKMCTRRSFSGAAIMVAAMTLGAAPINGAVTIDLVEVGNPGNAADPATGSLYGAVASNAWIGKYEVTIGQYTEFLNAVAGTDTYGLYDTLMGTNANIAGITRSGASGSYTYAVTGPAGVKPAGANSPGNRPIAYITWYRAARFANWMANGQPTGLQTATTTENGAYALNGTVSGTAARRNATNPNTGSAPIYTLPLENTWYKAAYYSPLLNSGSGGYYSYATQSSSDPGNTIGNSANQANFTVSNRFSVTQQTTFSGTQNYLTDVGAFTNSASYYGTFDQTGNVREWVDPNVGSQPVYRGGPWGNSIVSQSSSDRVFNNPDTTNFALGFRLASPIAVPEPSTMVFGATGVCLVAWRSLRRRAHG
ncbi:MAG: formylglycine-generating enzyme family protein [Planctomycetaceae bacterium]